MTEISLQKSIKVKNLHTPKDKTVLCHINSKILAKIQQQQ